MSYIVIARRWRPQQFSDIIGQEHVSKTLSNAIANNRIAHAYIFTGPRGVGKTTSARILAKAVNCQNGPTPTPCNECPSCKAITIGNSMDVLEIDGASNRGIDEIRNLRENIRYTPSLGKYRIYIIDEVHMLTKEAFNALLKTLEEPPAHVLFIFATTEIHRVPATILSRCQRFDFRRIPLKTIIGQLRLICQTDQIEIDDDALLQIAKKADGSMRDSQSILDQIISYCGNKISFADVGQALGVIHQDYFFRVSDHVLRKEIKELILLAKEIVSSGYDLTEFLSGLEDHFRNILVVRATGSTELLDVSENYLERYKEIAGKFAENDLVGYLQAIFETSGAIKVSQQPHLKFELGLIRLAKMPLAIEIEQILQKLDLLKKKALKPDAAIVREQQAPLYRVNPDISSKTADPLDLSVLITNWPAIIQQIHEKRPTLANGLEQAALEYFEQGVLQIRLHNNAMKESLQDIIEKTLFAIYKTRIQVRFSISSPAPEAVKEQVVPQKVVDKKIIMQKVREESALMAQIIDELDLEVV